MHNIATTSFLWFLLPLAAQDPVAQLCERLAPVVAGTLAPGKAMALPAADGLARIAAVAPGPLDAAMVAAVTHAWPDDDDAEARLVRVPVGDAAGRQVALVASTDGQVRGGAVLDKDGAVWTAGNDFIAQLVGGNVPALASAVARSAVQQRIEQFERADDPAGKANAALVDVRRQMVAQARAANAILLALEQGAAPDAKDVATLRAAYTALQQRSAALSAVLGGSQADYERLRAAVLARLDALPAAADAKARQLLHKQLKGDCRDCHELKSPKFEGGFEEWTRNERLRLGLGERVFAVGYDVVAGGLPAAEAQTLADACYRAALLLDACRGS